MSDLDAIVSAVASSKKYRAICDATIRRIARRELAHQGNRKAVIKATKRRLHQIYGAFEQDLDYEALYRRLEEAHSTGSDGEREAACRHVLGLHSSTRERLPILEEFYSGIFQATGRPGTILDLGCGLNPLALPWMGLAPGTRYIALDIDADRVRFVNRWLAMAGFEPLARCQDLLSHPSDDVVDVALLLKMGPSLERQEPGATQRILERLDSRFAVVSFAVKSLGGRDKGMPDQYGRQFLNLAQNRGWPVERLDFETELAFVVEI